VKITINGEEFAYDFDFSHMPMSEALAIEKVANRRYVEWEMAFTGGGAEAMAVFACLVWSRDGRDVKVEDVLSGKVDFDFSEAYSSVIAGIVAARQEAMAAAANPTSPAEPLTVPAGTPSTPSGTRASSPRSSA
jgi:hypothetical protein